MLLLDCQRTGEATLALIRAALIRAALVQALRPLLLVPPDAPRPIGPGVIAVVCPDDAGTRRTVAAVWPFLWSGERAIAFRRDLSDTSDAATAELFGGLPIGSVPLSDEVATGAALATFLRDARATFSCSGGGGPTFPIVFDEVADRAFRTPASPC